MYCILSIDYDQTRRDLVPAGPCSYGACATRPATSFRQQCCEHVVRALSGTKGACAASSRASVSGAPVRPAMMTCRR